MMCQTRAKTPPLRMSNGRCAARREKPHSGWFPSRISTSQNGDGTIEQGRRAATRGCAPVNPHLRLPDRGEIGRAAHKLGKECACFEGDGGGAEEPTSVQD